MSIDRRSASCPPRYAGRLECVRPGYLAYWRWDTLRRNSKLENTPNRRNMPIRIRASRCERIRCAPKIKRIAAKRRTTYFRGPEAAGSNDRGTSASVDHYLANCLLIHNQGEIEINQFAEGRAENEDVKQFAQQMIRDHQQLGEKLERAAESDRDANRELGAERARGNRSPDRREVRPDDAGEAGRSTGR